MSDNVDHGDNKKENELLDLSQLPKATGTTNHGATLFQDSWFPSQLLQNVISFQKKFKAHDHDIILASNPKSGTTWLKSLAFSILNRHLYTPSNTPLLRANPHELVPFCEFTLYCDPPIHDLSRIASPRLLSTHVPYTSLPIEIITNAGPHSPRIVYVCRNPLDTIVSLWHFMNRGHPLKYPQWTMEECVDTFCKGENNFGPFWRHVLGYWKASLERPEKVLFLKYEDMLEEPVSQLKRLALFMGFPFSADEERNGVVQQIIKLCSIESLKGLEVNKNGKYPGTQVGDSGLTFKYKI